MDGPRIAIIIVNYLDYEITVNCIESIKNLNYNNFFIVLVDNESPNESFNSLSHRLKCDAFWQEKIILKKAKRNGGYSYGNNLGIKIARSKKPKYLLILNPDTKIIDPLFLDKLVHRVEQDNKIALLGPGIIENNRLKNPRDILRPIPYIRLLQYIWPYLGKKLEIKRSDEIIKRSIDVASEGGFPVFTVDGSCMFLSYKHFKEIGFFDENLFLFGEESLVGEKFFRKGYRVYYYPFVQIEHFPSSTTRQKYDQIKKYKSMFNNELYYFREYRADIPHYLMLSLVLVGYFRFYIYLPFRVYLASAISKMRN